LGFDTERIGGIIFRIKTEKPGTPRLFCPGTGLCLLPRLVEVGDPEIDVPPLELVLKPPHVPPNVLRNGELLTLPSSQPEPLQRQEDGEISTRSDETEAPSVVEAHNRSQSGSTYQAR